jgi:hypothetical protein
MGNFLPRWCESCRKNGCRASTARSGGAILTVSTVIPNVTRQPSLVRRPAMTRHKPRSLSPQRPLRGYKRDFISELRIARQLLSHIWSENSLGFLHGRQKGANEVVTILLK